MAPEEFIQRKVAAVEVAKKLGTIINVLTLACFGFLFISGVYMVTFNTWARMLVSCLFLTWAAWVIFTCINELKYITTKYSLQMPVPFIMKFAQQQNPSKPVEPNNIKRDI